MLILRFQLCQSMRLKELKLVMDLDSADKFGSKVHDEIILTKDETIREKQTTLVELKEEYQTDYQS